jgi:hypothetical protein
MSRQWASTLDGLARMANWLRQRGRGDLGDPPLAMAFLDRVVDGAILLKIRGKSYRAHRAKKASGPPKPENP